MGKPESTVRSWINRGLAHPQEEPYGSFAVDYCRAERGIAAAIQETAAMKVQLLREQMEKRLRWEDRAPPPPRPTPPAKPGRSSTEDERQRYSDELHAYEQSKIAWDIAMEAWATPPPTPGPDEMAWLERHREARFPEDYGSSKHRKPEAPYDAQEWLDSHVLEREQLGALLRDPPEAIRHALVDAAPEVYAILVAGGFDPTAATVKKGVDSDSADSQ